MDENTGEINDTAADLPQSKDVQSNRIVACAAGIVTRTPPHCLRANQVSGLSGSVTIREMYVGSAFHPVEAHMQHVVGHATEIPVTEK